MPFFPTSGNNSLLSVLFPTLNALFFFPSPYFLPPLDLVCPPEVRLLFIPALSPVTASQGPAGCKTHYSFSPRLTTLFQPKSASLFFFSLSFCLRLSGPFPLSFFVTPVFPKLCLYIFLFLLSFSELSITHLRMNLETPQVYSLVLPRLFALPP